MKKLSVWIVLNIEEQLSTDLQNLPKNTFIKKNVNLCIILMTVRQGIVCRFFRHVSIT